MVVNGEAVLDELRTAVENLSIFNGVSDDALKELASIARCHDYPKNNILFYQGDPPDSAFLVVSGRVKCTLMNEEGREVVLYVVRPGGMLGLIAALDGGSQPANAITAVPSRLARFSVDEFSGWLERHETMQKVLLREFGKRVREAYHKIGEHALMGVKERLLIALLDIAEREGEPEPGSEAIVFTRPTHQELASRIGSSREVVSRLLKELLESDLLQAEGRIIRVSESALVLREDTGV
jgi:CRP/FNR family transcriptional regulator, cyclic AMP receptor protein